ncbi:MAG: hypothetical protein H7282_00305 [Cytophagaceae bacterium]|nr:hypothetical protein [Cytophagaceae bacterium]
MNTYSSISIFSKKLFRLQFILLFCIVGLSILSSCKKDVVDPLLLSVNPNVLVMNITGGTNLALTINASGPKNLQRFKMEVQRDNVKTILLDSVLNWGNKFSFLYNYTVPTSNANYSQVIVFTVLDADGNTAQTSRTMNVSATSTVPTEKTGIKIATKQSGNADAFDLLNQEALMSDLTATTLQDILDVPYTTASMLSHSLKSNNNAKFLSFDGFNYPNATKESIESAFNSGASVSQINNLAAGSIVLVQTNRGSIKRYYAIQITAANEDVGNNDFYLFSMKY